MASNTDYYALIKPAVTDKREIGPINTNMDTIDAALHTLDTGKKAKQSAKTDPTASGTAAAFIDSITQNANGEITATKKSVRDASTSQSGLMSAADKTKLNGISTGANRVYTATKSVTVASVPVGYSEAYINNDGVKPVGVIGWDINKPEFPIFIQGIVINTSDTVIEILNHDVGTFANVKFTLKFLYIE